MKVRFFKQLILGAVFLFCARAFAFELFQFEIAPKYSLVNGQMNEHLYYIEGPHVSELNWDFTAISCLGFTGSVTWEFLTLDADLTWGLQKESGTMYDSDWLNKNNYGMKTNYTESANRLDSYFDSVVKLNANIKPVSFLTISPFLGIQYTRIKFIANGGFGWYGDKDSTKLSYHVPYTDPLAKPVNFDSYGDVISYEIEKLHYLLGTKVTFCFLTRFKISLMFDTAFYSIYNCLDKHLATNTAYLDRINTYFNSFDLGTTVDIKIWNGISAGTAFGYHLILARKGKDYTKDTDKNSSYKIESTRMGGFSANYWNLDFFVKYSF